MTCTVASSDEGHLLELSSTVTLSILFFSLYCELNEICESLTFDIYEIFYLPQEHLSQQPCFMKKVSKDPYILHSPTGI